MHETFVEKDTFLYRVARILSFLAFHTLFPVLYHGKENLKDVNVPYVIIANHVHAMDPFICAYPVKHQQCYFLGKKELGKNRFVRFLMDHLHCILVDRHHADMEAMRACMKAMKMNKVLVIFPEGTRHHEGQMEHIESGTGLIVMRSKVPMIPMYIDRPLKLFRKVNVYIGKPIEYEDILSNGINTASCEALNDRMRDTFREIIRKAEEGNKKIA